MNTLDLLNPLCWAEATFGSAQLKDRRRTRRVVRAAACMAENASASLPAQMQTWKEVLAVYRLLSEEDVTFEALMQPHWQQTYEQMEAHQLVLLVQDTTEVDLTSHPKMTGLGPLGTERGRGLYLQTMLAVLPERRAVLGCALQEPFLRRSAPEGEGRDQRRQRRQRETDIWKRLVERLFRGPAQTTLVHVGDRGADIFAFFHACRSTQTHFLVRAAQNRRAAGAEEESTYLLTSARGWPSQDGRAFEVPASHGRQARSTRLQIAWGPMRVLPPRWEPDAPKEAMELWVIRVWEDEPPADEEPLEWLLLTSVPTVTLEQAWERVAWYTCRWVVEDYHQCLKTGCRIEARQLHSVERWMRLLGLLSPVAVRLLQLRDLARAAPERLASEVVAADLLAVVAAQTHQSPALMTTADFWRAVARLGGYLARTSDGPPGWKTLWRGWLRVQTLVEGVHLAPHLRL